MTVRRGRSEDLPACLRLQSHLQAPSPDLLRSADSVGTLLVSPDDRGEPAGYLLAVGRTGGDAHVAELVVAPAHRRERRATALLTAFLDRCSPGTRVTLNVAADNDAARSLYESIGFEAVDRRPDFYPSSDALVYALTVERR
jgi:ribosomal-protein-alanine N-acetyltransferase